MPALLLQNPTQVEVAASKELLWSVRSGPDRLRRDQRNPTWHQLLVRFFRLPTRRARSHLLRRTVKVASDFLSAQGTTLCRSRNTALHDHAARLRSTLSWAK